MKTLLFAPVIALAAFALFCPVNAQSPTATLTLPFTDPNTQWVAKSLRRMETIKIGMSRAQLLRVFTTEGGISTRSAQTYIYRQCPYFKVNVNFRRVGRETGGNLNDKIVSISDPYLQWSVLN